MENINNKVTITTDQSNHDMTGKKTYQAPKLQHYGSLAELVQARIGGGNDGGLQPDCAMT